MNNRRLLMISTDRLIFDKDSAVRARQVEYARGWERVDIVIFNLTSYAEATEVKKSEISNLKSDPVRQWSDSKKNLRLKGQIVNEQISENCWVYSTESFFKLFYPFDAIKIGTKIIEENNITDITCQDSSLTAMAGVSLKKKFGLPLEIQIHGDIGSPYFARNIINKIRLKLARKYLPKADKIRVVSDRIKNYVEKLLEEKRYDRKPEIEVRPILVDNEAIKNAPIIIDLHRKYRHFDQIVLMASRLEKEKNIDLAIKTWPLILKHFPKAGLIIVGTGNEELKLKKLVADRELDKSVVFERWANKETLYSYYKTADLFLNTSFFEGYGMTLVEAKTVGCPIVSTDVGVAKEIGAMLADFSSDSVANKIIGVLSTNKKENV